MARTAEQRIASLEAKLAREKKRARAQRTRRLIENGAIFEKAAELIRTLPLEVQKNAFKQLAANAEIYAGKIVANVKPEAEK